MTLRMPDFRNPEAVTMTMSKDEYDKYQKHGKEIQQDLKILEIEAELQSKSDTEVSMLIKPVPRDFLGSIFVNHIAGGARFITMRVEEFAQNLEDYGFTVEFS